MDRRALLNGLFEAAVAAADPMRVVPDALPSRPSRLFVVGAGKASARMAEAVESQWGACRGLVITRYGHARPCRGIEIVEAAHPVPDMAGVEGTRRMLDAVRALGEDDFVLALISGGGSALLCAPPGDITLEDKQAVVRGLLASGAPIGDINGVRKQISAVKGGRLAAAAHPAQVLALMISDVPGDDPGDIASGPTVGDEGDAARALETLEHWGVEPPDRVRRFLERGGDPVRPDDMRLARTENRVIAAPGKSLEAAVEAAEAVGVRSRILGDAIEGEAREVARDQVLQARRLQAELSASDAPFVLLSGGEVTVSGGADGRGGPNAEFVLAAAAALDGASGIHVIACDTDGVDGSDEIAGAVAGPDTPAKARERGVSIEQALSTHDSHAFFEAIGDGVVTGPTLTNVNDFRALLVEPL